MKSVLLKRSLSEYKKVKNLYLTAFPKIERISFWLMRLLCLRKNTELRAWFDEGQMVGFTYSSSTNKYSILGYFAVNPEVRSKGYGSRIIKEVRNLHGGVPMIVDIEYIPEGTPNNDMKIRRKQFYEMNGFEDTGYVISSMGELYHILLTDDRGLDVKEASKCLGRCFFTPFKPYKI